MQKSIAISWEAPKATKRCKDVWRGVVLPSFKVLKVCSRRIQVRVPQGSCKLSTIPHGFHKGGVRVPNSREFSGFYKGSIQVSIPKPQTLNLKPYTLSPKP